MSGRRPNRREVAAAETRREILRAARRLFAAHGYAGTSLQQIAEESGVAVQTIYSSVGSKAALVLALNDLIDEEAGVAQLGAGVRAETDPPTMIAKAIHLTRQLNERCGDLLQVLLSAAPAEPDVAAAFADGMRLARVRRPRNDPAPGSTGRPAGRHDTGAGRRRVRHDDVGAQLAAAHPARRLDLRRQRGVAHGIPHPASAGAQPLSRQRPASGQPCPSSRTGIRASTRTNRASARVVTDPAGAVLGCGAGQGQVRHSARPEPLGTSRGVGQAGAVEENRTGGASMWTSPSGLGAS